jgi:hypothetical protein
MFSIAIALAPIGKEILLCRCSAQKIALDSGKQLLKNKFKQIITRCGFFSKVKSLNLNKYL